MLNRLAGRRGHSQRGGSTRVRTLVTWSRLLLCLLLLPVRERLVRHGATDADGHRGPDGGPRQGDAEMSMTSFHMSRMLSSRAWHAVTRRRAAGVSFACWSRRAATRCSRAASKSYWRLSSRLSARTSMVTPRVRRCGTQTAGTEAGTEGSARTFPQDHRSSPSASTRRPPCPGRQPSSGRVGSSAAGHGGATLGHRPSRPESGTPAGGGRGRRSRTGSHELFAAHGLADIKSLRGTGRSRRSSHPDRRNHGKAGRSSQPNAASVISQRKNSPSSCRSVPHPQPARILDAIVRRRTSAPTRPRPRTDSGRSHRRRGSPSAASRTPPTDPSGRCAR